LDLTLSEVQQSWRAKGQSLGSELSEDPAAGDVVDGAARVGLIDPKADLLSAALATEALACESAGAAIAYAAHITAVLGLGLDPQFSALVRGEIAGAVGLASEYPAEHAGTLSGRAAWVGPLTTRGVAIVGARHRTEGEGITACAVSLDASGVTLDPVSTAALRGFVCGHVLFEQAPCLPIGSTMPTMTRMRVLLAAAGLGMGRRALQEALRSARAYNRTGAGGEQTVQGLLADAATELDAARLLTWKAASAPEPSLAEASMAKLAVTEATQRAVARATQIVGGDTFRRGHIIERLAQDVRALELFAGRTEALREAAADYLLPHS
jgi:alkylation response protein AidB-like acyl-CoA dehydrogenase